MRLVIPDLIPGTPYLIQVRADNGAQQSEWSPAFALTTEEDKTPPITPTGLTWVSTGDSFFAEWNSVGLNTNGAVSVVVRYELEMTASGTTRIVSTTQQTGQKPNYSMSFENNRALFGTPRASVSLRVRAIDNRGNASAWTASVNAQNPVPVAPTNVVATAGTNQISLNWTPDTSANNNDVIGFNVYTSSNTLLGFVNGTSFVYRTTTYSAQTFRVAAIDKFNQESTRLDSNTVTPESPFASDTTPPAVPVFSGTLTNNANGVGASASLTWTQTVPSPDDLAGFEIRYRKSGGTVYSSGGRYDAAARSAIVEVPDAYVAHVFQIRSVDRYANYSAWSTDLSISPAASTTPAKVSDVVSVPGREEIRYSWSPSASPDLKNYETTISTSSTFANNNITFFTGTSATLVVSGLNPNTTYYFRVRVISAASLTGAWSDTDSETTTQQINGDDITSLSADKITAGTLGSNTGVIQIASGASLVFNGGFLKSNTYLPNQYQELSGAGWYLGNDGLRIADGSISSSALKSGVITAATIVVGNQGAIQSANYGAQPPPGQNPAGFRLSETGLDIPNGSLSARKLNIADNTLGVNEEGQVTSINGGMIRTGEIRSNATENISVPGTPQPMWLIGMDGSAKFTNMRVMGATVLGRDATDTESWLASSNYSPGTSGWSLRGDGTGDLRGLSADSINVDSLASGDLSVPINLTGSLVATGYMGAQVGISSTEGFFVRGPIPEGQDKGPEYISFPILPSAEGTLAPNIISGVLNATTVSVRGNEKGEAASFFAKNYMELNSSLILRNKIAASVAAPSVSTTHIYSGQPSVSGFSRMATPAMASSSGNMYAIFDSRTSNEKRIYTFPATGTPSYVVLSDYFEQFYEQGSESNLVMHFETKNLGVVGNEFFLLGMEHVRERVTNYTIYQIAVWTFNSSGQFLRRNVVSSTGENHIRDGYSLGTSATEVYIANPINHNNNPNYQFRRYSPSDLSAPLATVNTSVSSNYKTYGFVVTNGDFGSLRYIIPSYLSQTTSEILSFNSAGTIQTNEKWHGGKYFVNSVHWNANPASFVGYTNSAIQEVNGLAGTFKYSNITWAGADSARWSTTVTKYDSSTNNESDLSPITYFTMRKRSHILITADSGGSPTQRVYLSNVVSGTPTYAQFWRQSATLGSGIRSVVYSNTVFSGSNANNRAPAFPADSTNAGVLQSEANDVLNISLFTTASSKNVSNTAGMFRPSLVGNRITGSNIPEDTFIESVSNANNAVLTKAATSSGAVSASVIGPVIDLRGSGFTRIKELYSDQAMFASAAEANASAGNKPALRVGNSFSNHLRISDDRIIAMDNDNTQADLYLNVNGITLTSKLIVTSSTDATPNAGNEPPIRVGDINGAHLRIDGNEIIAMQSDATSGANFLLNTGGPVQMGGFQFNNGTIQALTGSIDFSVTDGSLRIVSGSSISGRLATTLGSGGASLALRNGMVIAGIQGYNSTNPVPSNTVQFHANGIFATDQTGSSAQAAQFGTGGRIVRVTSSRRYKDNILPMDIAKARKALDLEPVTFLLKDDLGHGIRRRRYPGFIAEQAHDVGMQDWVVYDDQNRPDSFRYPEMAAAHNMLIKELYGKIETLEATNSTVVEEKIVLEDRLTSLEAKVDQILALGS